MTSLLERVLFRDVISTYVDQSRKSEIGVHLQDFINIDA